MSFNLGVHAYSKMFVREMVYMYVACTLGLKELLANVKESGWTGTSSFVFEVPLHNLRPSVIYSVPCDRIVQRAY